MRISRPPDPSGWQGQTTPSDPSGWQGQTTPAVGRTASRSVKMPQASGGKRFALVCPGTEQGQGVPTGGHSGISSHHHRPDERPQALPLPPRILSLVLAVAVLAACAAPAPEPETEAEPRPPVETRAAVDKAVATTGDVITYTVTVDYDPAFEIDLPEPGAEIAGFRIIDVSREDPREEGGRRIEERWYQLRADLVGSYVLPPVAVTYRPVASEEAGEEESEAEAQTVESSEIFVEVESVLPADAEVTDIRGLKPLREIRESWPWWWIAGAGGLGLLVLVGAVIGWRRSRRPVEIPPRPAHELAFEALDALRGTDFEDLEAMRRFHFAISGVIRAYVENRFELNATDLTTEEILGSLDELRGLDGDGSQRLERFLVDTDQVKFADYRPSEDEIGRTYEGALSFVEATRYRPEEAAA